MTPDNEQMKFLKQQSEMVKQMQRRTYRDLNKVAQKGQILFTGSSLMEQFPINEIIMSMGVGKIIYNRGIGGTTTDEFLEHIDTVLLDLAPSKVFINIGTNDIVPRSDGEPWQDHLLKNYEKILDILREKLPETEVYMMAFYPVNPELPDAPERMKLVLKVRTNAAIGDTNTKLAALAEKMHVHFIDCNAGLRDSNGNQKAEFSKDGIHMYPAAYLEVFQTLRPYL